MIEPVRRHSRTGLGVVISVLVVVGGFWTLRMTQTEWFQTYIREVRLKRTLRTIQPPPGAKLLLMTTDRGPYGFVSGVDVYSTDLEFDKVKSHYLREFAQHGFVYQGDTVKDSNLQVNFCALDYQATLVPMLESSPQLPKTNLRLYMISTHWKNAPC